MCGNLNHAKWLSHSWSSYSFLCGSFTQSLVSSLSYSITMQISLIFSWHVAANVFPGIESGGFYIVSVIYMPLFLNIFPVNMLKKGQFSV